MKLPFRRKNNHRLWERKIADCRKPIRGRSLFLHALYDIFGFFERESIPDTSAARNSSSPCPALTRSKWGKKKTLSLGNWHSGRRPCDNEPWNRIWITVKLVARRLLRCNTLAGFCYNWPVSLVQTPFSFYIALFRFDSQSGQVYNDVWSSF